MHGCNRPSRTHRALPPLPPRTINHTRYRTPNFKFGETRRRPTLSGLNAPLEGCWGVFDRKTGGHIDIRSDHFDTVEIKKRYRYIKYRCDMLNTASNLGLQDVKSRSRDRPRPVAAPQRCPRARGSFWPRIDQAPCPPRPRSAPSSRARPRRRSTPS